MITSRDIAIRDARADDAAAILAIQRRAFAPAALRYADPALPPLVERVDEVERDIVGQSVLVAEDADGSVVGSVRGRLQYGCVHVGRLVVEPTAQRRGVATRLMRELEARFPDAERFELFTGGMNEPGMGLYLKLGYRETRRERLSDLLELVHMSKAADPDDHGQCDEGA